MTTNRLLILCLAAIMCFGTAFTQSQTIPSPTAEHQAKFHAAIKEVRMRRQALQSAAASPLSLVNCGQLTLAQSQLETAEVKMQLVLTRIADQLGLDSNRYDAIEDKEGRLVFAEKKQSSAEASPTPQYLR